MRERASAYRTWGGGIAISAPWLPGRTPALVELLKSAIPVYARRYDSDTHQWHVAAAYADDALRILVGIFPDADTPTGAGRRPRPAEPSQEDDPYRALYVTPDAPAPVVEAAYRALCRIAHPDIQPEGARGLAHQRMVAINGAMERVRRLRGVA